MIISSGGKENRERKNHPFLKQLSHVNKIENHVSCLSVCLTLIPTNRNRQCKKHRKLIKITFCKHLLSGNHSDHELTSHLHPSLQAIFIF